MVVVFQRKGGFNHIFSSSWGKKSWSEIKQNELLNHAMINFDVLCQLTFPNQKPFLDEGVTSSRWTLNVIRVLECLNSRSVQSTTILKTLNFVSNKMTSTTSSSSHLSRVGLDKTGLPRFSLLFNATVLSFYYLLAVSRSEEESDQK